MNRYFSILPPRGEMSEMTVIFVGFEVVGDPGGSPRHKNFDSRKFAGGGRREAGRGGGEIILS